MKNSRNKRQFNYQLKQIKAWEKSNLWDSFTAKFQKVALNRLKRLANKIEYLFTPKFASALTLFLAISLSGMESSAQTFLPPDSAAFNMTLPFGGMYVSYHPTIADMDADGDYDMLISNWGGELSYFENLGSPENPDFSSVVYNPFNFIDVPTYYGSSHIAAVDLDADGDFDLMASGHNYGEFYYYENTGTNILADFAAPQLNPFGLSPPYSYYSNHSPAFVDIDDDGDLDMFTGSNSGEIIYYENIGTPNLPAFNTPVIDPFGLVDLGSYSFPAFIDLDQDGDQDFVQGVLIGDVVSGNYSLIFHENIGDKCNPQFGTPQALNMTSPDITNPYKANISPCFADMDNDGDLDLFVGYRGNGHFYYMEQDIGTLSIYSDPVQNIDVCGGSNYIYPDGTVENNITDSVTHISYLTTVISGCDSTITTNLSVIPVLYTSENINLCPGADYIFPDGTIQTGITDSTSHVSTLSTVVTGCDSVVTTNIIMLPDFSTSENVELCSGETYIYPDGNWETNITNPVSHISYLYSLVTACDSIITTNILILQPYNGSETIEICEGENYTYPDGTVETNITGSIVHISEFTSVISGCDSSITTNILVNPDYTLIEDIFLCYGDNFTYPDGTTESNITDSASHVSNLSSVVSGCDSTITTNIYVNPAFALTEDVFLCHGDDIIYPDGTMELNIIQPVTHINNLSSVAGCDSVITTSIHINPNYSITEDLYLCSGDSVTYPDGTIEVNVIQNTSHDSYLSTVDGCDSVITSYINVPEIDTSVTSDGIIITANDPWAQYQWINCDGNISISGANDQSFTPSETGNYLVELMVDGCIDSSACENIIITQIDNPNFNTKAIEIWPNPTDRQIFIDLMSVSKEDLPLVIRNSIGQIVVSESLLSGTQHYKLDLDQPKGIYFLSILGNTYKVIIK